VSWRSIGGGVVTDPVMLLSLGMHSLVLSLQAWQTILQLMQQLHCEKDQVDCVGKQHDPARTLLDNTTHHAEQGIAREILVYRSA